MARYFNYENNRDEIFRCQEDRLQGQTMCFLHSEQNNISSSEEFDQLINERITRAIENNEPIMFIGCIFPFALSIKMVGNHMYMPHMKPDEHEAHIRVPIYFSYAKIRSHFEITNYHLQAIYFDNATFDGEVVIAASLLEKCTFKYCKFNNLLNFSMLRMVDADFTVSTFSQSAKFTGALIHKCSFLAAKFDGHANFASATFFGRSDLSNIKFNSEVTFSGSKFLDVTFFNYSIFKERANFEEVVFKKRTDFNNVLFVESEKVIFNASNLSMLSFKHVDITRVKFGDVQWREGKKYKIIDEEDLEWSFKPVIHWGQLRTSNIESNDNLLAFLKYRGVIENEELLLENQNERIMILRRDINGDTNIGNIYLSEDSTKATIQIGEFSYTFVSRNDQERIYYPLKVNLQSVLSIYRNLRENYEYRLRYDEAGSFFLREMEIKRKYNESFQNDILNYYKGYKVELKNKIYQTLSLTGIYYNVARYGESVAIPTIIGILIISFSTLLFVMEENPINQYSVYNFIGLKQINNATQWAKSFERSTIDFIPLLNFNSYFILGGIDYVIKILGAVFTFGLIAIALKRKFERKIRH